jgi:hypothetical protein
MKRGNYSIFHTGYLVIKSVAFFPLQTSQNSEPVIQAITHALHQAGIRVEQNSWNSDAAIVWSVLWSGRMSANQSVYTHYRAQGKPVIVVDIGALYRGETWKIAVNNITADGYYGHQENLDWDRPRRLGISLAINLTQNPRIVIAAQHARSLQVENLVSIESWIIEQVQQLRLITNRPLVVRPHPRSRLNMKALSVLPKDVSVEQPQKVLNTYDSYNLAFDCHAMVNYNSGPGIQAALAGTRPIVDSTSLAWPVGIKMCDIDQPYKVDRDQWLTEICHTEYTVEEIKQGRWLTRLAPALELNHG